MASDPKSEQVNLTSLLRSLKSQSLLLYAGVAQLVERNLAKVEVASSRLVSRSKFEGSLWLPFCFDAYKVVAL